MNQLKPHRILILFALLVVINCHFSQAQVAKIRSYDGIGVGTSSMFYFVEPLIKTINPQIVDNRFSANEFGYSIMYKGLRTSGENTIFPCIPKAFTVRAGIEFRPSTKVSRINSTFGMQKYWFGAAYIGAENTIWTDYNWLTFTLSMDIAAYKQFKLFEDFKDNKFYVGVAPGLGMNFYIGKSWVLITETNLFVGFRNFSRENMAEGFSEEENALVMGAGIPHFFGATLMYMIQ
ncbi:MAG: hypothetical protein IH946_09625 [Bacteroidetes bacterium]|nr:hypothetical protein [Bacteroidota bacterium]